VTWKFKLLGLIYKLPVKTAKDFAQKTIRSMIPPNEVLYILNLKDGSKKRSAELSLDHGINWLLPSPGFRYAFCHVRSGNGADWAVCDLERNQFTKITLGGVAAGWWDEHNILVIDRQNNCFLFDVMERQTTTLLRKSDISKVLQELELPDDPAALGMFLNWNTNGYDFFFTLEKEKNWGKSFLLKLDRTTKTLKLVSRSFKFQWGGHLDPEEKHYVYEGENGEPGRSANGGVNLRNLVDDSVRTLVEPDNRGQYALARFCANGVIYSRNKQLFWVDLSGSNNAPLFQSLKNR